MDFICRFACRRNPGDISLLAAPNGVWRPSIPEEAQPQDAQRTARSERVAGHERRVRQQGIARAQARTNQIRATAEQVQLLQTTEGAEDRRGKKGAWKPAAAVGCAPHTVLLSSTAANTYVQNLTPIPLQGVIDLQTSLSRAVVLDPKQANTPSLRG